MTAFTIVNTSIGRSGAARRPITQRCYTRREGLYAKRGKVVFHLFGALGQVERDLIHERPQAEARLTTAAARGRVGGRKPVVTVDKLQWAREHIADGLNVRRSQPGFGRANGFCRANGVTPKRRQGRVGFYAVNACNGSAGMHDVPGRHAFARCESCASPLPPGSMQAQRKF